MKKRLNQFNIIIVGTGGQGLITLLQILAEAALKEGYDVKTSELHGLSQRGGSVEVHIRFGKTTTRPPHPPTRSASGPLIYSPMVAQGKADLVLGLEEQEILNGVYFASSKTNFLINQFILPIPLKKPLTENEILYNSKNTTRPKL